MNEQTTFHLYAAGYRENAKNTRYPHQITVSGLDELKEAVKNDHIAARMKEARRSIGNFISADCLMMDIDNTHSEEPEDWVSPDDVADALPGVMFFYIFSRNHMKPKRKTAKDGTVINYAPRGKYHFYFPMAEVIKSPAEYDAMAGELCKVFPYFDQSADDAAHFFFGVEAPDGGFCDGEMTLDKFLGDVPVVPATSPTRAEPQEISWIDFAEQQKAVEWFKTWAVTHDAKWWSPYRISATSTTHPNGVAFCVDCPWSDEHSMEGAENESVVIIDISGKLNFLCRHSHSDMYDWKKYRAKIEASAAHEHPDAAPAKNETLEPGDYSDLGEAEVFVREYGSKVRYSKATGFLAYNGCKWEEDALKVQRMTQELTARQLQEARTRIRGARASLDTFIEAEDQDQEGLKAAKAAAGNAERYRKFVLSRRASSRIRATMAEVAPFVQIDVKELDANPYVLNTPQGTINLETGEIRPHNASDFCTKITAVGPGSDGEKVWSEFLERLTVGDAELARYLQDIAGTCAIGCVRREEIIIALGTGGNGKSTVFNVLSRVMGDYSGMLSADTLTQSSKQNRSPEFAELRGKRLVLAAELEEGRKLDVSVVKKLASTDSILAERKYHDPFVFVPSHHLILYTNFLPRVSSNDEGTWARLCVVPFRAKFRGEEGEVKDYADYLFKMCGGAVLSWIVEGARRVISQNFIISRPQCVDDQIRQYRAENDWLQGFIDDRCIVGPREVTAGGALYSEYRTYCSQTGEYTRHNSDFSKALEAAGYEGHRTKRGKEYRGLRIKNYFELKRDGIIPEEIPG